MTTYAPPLREMLFAMKEHGGLDAVLAQPGNEEVTGELVGAILDCDYDTVVTSSLDEAEIFWTENRSQVAVVLSDLCLPDAKSTMTEK
jgi:hypothetical protein